MRGVRAILGPSGRTSPGPRDPTGRPLTTVADPTRPTPDVRPSEPRAAQLRFGALYDSMRWAAENLGGGWARMWADGVGEMIRRRATWFSGIRDGLARELS